MNHLTPYEPLIAQKVEQIAVPDLADSIWANIEQQLDDIPPGDDEGNGDTSPDAPPHGGLPAAGKGLYLFITAAVISTAFIFYQNNKHKTPESGSQPVPLQPFPSDPGKTNENTISNPPANTITPRKATIHKIDSNTTDDRADDIPGVADSLNKVVVYDNAPDTSMTRNDKTVQPVADTAAHPPAKKPKGVKGITEDDYKIKSSNKDSAKQGQ